METDDNVREADEGQCAYDGEVDRTVAARLSDSNLKVKINTFVWENAPGQWTLDRADDVACKMFKVFRHAEVAAAEAAEGK